MRPAFVADVDQFTSATRYALDLTVDVDGLTLSGVGHVRYTNQETEPLTEIAFRLLPNLPGYGGTMTVSSAQVDGATVDPALSNGESTLYLPLGSPLSPGETVEVVLTFEGTLPSDPSAGYAQYGYYDGVLALPNAYPMIPVYDDEGWNAELARPYGDAAFTDTSLYQVRVTLPSDMVLASSGITLDQQDNLDGTTTHSLASGPMRDFNVVASADYETVSTTVGDVLVTSYYLPGSEEGGERALDYAAESLRLYEDRIGPYPFTELDVMATPTQAGGIEYPGLIVVGERLYDQQGGFFEFATVHEVAHQWWYSLVGNDQLDEPWLDEALTQYTSLLYYEDRYGKDTAQAVMQNAFEGPYRRIRENEQDMAVGLPVEAYPEDLYGAVVYGKGPLFFDALRQRVGDRVFYKILNSYFDGYRYDVAYPEDFMAVAERVSGEDLSPLYSKWILGE
jgi:aminopeptidase N